MIFWPKGAKGAKNQIGFSSVLMINDFFQNFDSILTFFGSV